MTGNSWSCQTQSSESACSTDFASSSVATFQEELVLRIAILAEKNAPDSTWYVDTVFKMIESARDAIDDGVWHRIIQVVGGSSTEGGDEDLQCYTACKAYQALVGANA